MASYNILEQSQTKLSLSTTTLIGQLLNKLFLGAIAGASVLALDFSLL